MTHEELVQLVLDLQKRVEDLEQLAGPPDPLELNHQAFVARIREQEARGSS